MRCPKCGEEIDYLENYQPGTSVYQFDLNCKGEPVYEQVDLLSDEAGEYECPECNVVLAHNENAAIAFMKGEGISDEMAEYYMKLAMEGKNS